MKSICLAVTCLVITSVATADTITVCLDGSCDYTGIQAAIKAASGGDVIEIAAGVYEPPATLDTLGKAITLSGHVDSKSGELLTILDGRGAIRILECINGESPTTVLQGLVFQSGLGGGPENYSYGGAAYLENAGPTFENCTFTGNSAWRDSAVDCRNNSHPYAEPVFNNCRFVANQQGAVGLQSFVTVHFNNCVFEENIGTSVNAREGSVAEMNACVFRNNEGGAFGSSSIAWANMYDCLIDGNQGGVSMTEGFGGEFVGCTFRENSGYSIMSLSSQRTIIGGSGFQTRITDCEFIANGDDASSAVLRMLFTDCDVRVVGCSFIDNVGLAIESRFTSDSVETAEDHPYISGCTITGNQGGGIWIRRSNAIVTGCDISCNTSGLTGAGIQATDCIEGGPTISTTVISNNNSSSSSHQSAGVYFHSNTDNPYFAENTVCSNASAQVSGDYDDGGGNQITDVCGGKYVTPGMDLNEVIQNALACSVLQLSEGTWALDSAIDLEGKGVTIRGSVDENGEPTSILDGNGTTRVLQLNSGENGVVFENLVIRNGNQAQGGGMYISGTASTPVIATFQNCIIRDNSAAMVGGGVASGGGVSFAGTTLCGNPGGNIYGDYIDNGGNCIVDGCTDSDGDGIPDKCAYCPADFNGNGIVDGGDLGSMLAAWGACSGCPEDLTGDGLVDGGDLGLLLAAFGPCS